MSRKDYVKIAAALQEFALTRDKYLEVVLIEDIAKRLADVLEQDNDGFKRSVFLDAVWSPTVDD